MPWRFLRDMRREIHAVEPTLAFLENQTMEDEVGMTLFPVRASAWLVSSIGLVAMLLAAVGLYGVIAYSVARRTREIGIRMALGASTTTVVGSVMRRGLLIAAFGLVAGVAAAVIALYFGSSLAFLDGSYGIRVSDPASWPTSSRPGVRPRSTRRKRSERNNRSAEASRSLPEASRPFERSTFLEPFDDSSRLAPYEL